MSAEFINPESLGPRGVTYSQIAVAGNLVFVAGQVGFDEKGQLRGPDAGSQTRQTLAQLDAVLKEAGFELTDVVQPTVFLHDISDAKEFDAAWRRVLGDHRATQATFDASAITAEILVEVQRIAQPAS